MGRPFVPLPSWFPSNMVRGILRIIVNSNDVDGNNVINLKVKKTMKCENCGNEHDGSYGSGRFCSSHCRHVYIGKQVKNHKCNFKPDKHRATYGTWVCRYCGIVFESKNKLYKHYHSEHKFKIGLPHNKGGTAWNKGLSKETDDRVRQSGETYKKRVASGEIIPSAIGRHVSEETRMKISRFQRHATYQRVCKRTQPYKKKDGTIVNLDSSWEIKLAEILDDLDIRWIRPKPMEWYDKSGKLHHYFSDFFLEDYNLYLDPKNDYCFLAQAEKIEYVQTHYDNVVFMNKDQLSKEFVVKLLNERQSNDV